MEKDLLQKARDFFTKDHFAANTRINIEEVNDEYSLCSLKIEDVHKNANGSVQGGAIFTLADMTFAVSANVGRLDEMNFAPTISQSASVSFFKSAKGSTLYAKSTCLSKGHTVSVYSIRVYDDLGVDIAQVMINGFTKTV